MNSQTSTRQAKPSQTKRRLRVNQYICYDPFFGKSECTKWLHHISLHFVSGSFKKVSWAVLISSRYSRFLEVENKASTSLWQLDLACFSKTTYTMTKMFNNMMVKNSKVSNSRGANLTPVKLTLWSTWQMIRSWKGQNLMNCDSEVDYL